MTTASTPDERRFPPIDKLADLAMVLVIIGGIYMAANLPGNISLIPAIALLVLAIIVLVVDVVLLARLQEFAWATFRLVAGWALLAYLVIAGMIGYAFVYDGTRGEGLVVLVGMLAVFAIAVPLLLGFSVARYQPSATAPEAQPSD
jgi:membrane-bound acyltransferase YfiQ involved in biofilm formation